MICVLESEGPGSLDPNAPESLASRLPAIGGSFDETRIYSDGDGDGDYTMTVRVTRVG